VPHKPVRSPESTGEQYIRVAAIDIITNAGIKNICVARTHEKLVSSATRSKQRRTVSNASDIRNGINVLGCCFGRKSNTIQIQIHEDLRHRRVRGGGAKEDLVDIPLARAGRWLQATANRHPLGQKSH